MTHTAIIVFPSQFKKEKYTPDTRTSIAVNKFEPGLTQSCKKACRIEQWTTDHLSRATRVKKRQQEHLEYNKRQTSVASAKNLNTFSTSKDLVLLLIFNFSISVTKALPTTKENMCVSTNLWYIKENISNKKKSYIKTKNK